VPAIHDPSSTTSTGNGFARTPFAGNAIPTGRMDPVAVALLQRYPLPTSTGTANNSRRVDNEVDSQQQVDGRLDQRFNDRDHAFVRLSMFHDDFTPVRPLPDGSGAVASGTAGPQQTRALALASDDASSVFDATILTGPVANAPVADSVNRALERDVSNGDIPHVFVAGATWILRGWSISPIVTLQSGIPLYVTQATNFNAFAGFGAQRPNRVGNPALDADARTTTRWFDTGAFAAAPQFTIGTSSRNPVRGPGYRSLDLAIARRFFAPLAIELRGEVFNVTNTPPLGAPNTVLGTPGFGSITSAGDPRVVQLAVKLSF
jgi:hypothetical protein